MVALSLRGRSSASAFTLRVTTTQIKQTFIQWDVERLFHNTSYVGISITAENPGVNFSIWRFVMRRVDNRHGFCSPAWSFIYVLQAGNVHFTGTNKFYENKDGQVRSSLFLHGRPMGSSFYVKSRSRWWYSPKYTRYLMFKSAGINYLMICKIDDKAATIGQCNTLMRWCRRLFWRLPVMPLMSGWMRVNKASKKI